MITFHATTDGHIGASYLRIHNDMFIILTQLLPMAERHAMHEENAPSLFWCHNQDENASPPTLPSSSSMQSQDLSVCDVQRIGAPQRTDRLSTPRQGRISCRSQIGQVVQNRHAACKWLASPRARRMSRLHASFDCEDASVLYCSIGIAESNHSGSQTSLLHFSTSHF